MGLGEHARAALYVSFAAFMFVVAVTSCLYFMSSVSQAIDMAHQMTKQTDHNMTSTLKITTPYTVSGAVVRQSIYKINAIGVDMMVDGVTYSKNLDPSTLNVSGISVTKEYTPSNIRDTQGNLTLVTFN